MQTASHGQQEKKDGAGIVIGVQIGLQFFGTLLKLCLPSPEAYGAALFLTLLLVYPWRGARYRACPFWRWAFSSLGWASLVAFVLYCVRPAWDFLSHWGPP